MKNKKFNFSLNNTLPYLLISLIPICWFIIFSNHSYIHVFFTCRTYIGLIYSILVMILLLFEEKIEFNNGNQEVENKELNEELKTKKIAVLLPCYNEHLTIKRYIINKKSIK